jgi:predicted NAD/FAD-dependent oxidoreductase
MKESENRSGATIVVGAGIAGLSAARELQRRGASVIVVDKGRGVGGRAATRRSDGVVYDHGAQFFTARSEEFRAEVDDWLNRGVVRYWTDRFPQRPRAGAAGDDRSSAAAGTGGDGSGVGGKGAPGRHARYRGDPGMTAIAKDFAQGLDIRLSTRVVTVRRPFELVTEAGDILPARGVILTPPVPQTIALLEAGGLAGAESRIRPASRAADPQAQPRLGDIDYDKCLVLLARLPAGDAGVASPLGEPGALRKPSDAIDWIADNGVKGVSPAAGALTVHFSPAFSDEYYDAPDADAAAAMLPKLREVLDVEPTEYQVKRWRYSKPRRRLDMGAATLPDLPGLVLAGDAFAGARVEGAYLSGRAAALSLADYLGLGDEAARSDEAGRSDDPVREQARTSNDTRE